MVANNFLQLLFENLELKWPWKRTNSGPEPLLKNLKKNKFQNSRKYLHLWRSFLACSIWNSLSKWIPTTALCGSSKHELQRSLSLVCVIIVTFITSSWNITAFHSTWSLREKELFQIQLLHPYSVRHVGCFHLDMCPSRQQGHVFSCRLSDVTEMAIMAADARNSLSKVIRQLWRRDWKLTQASTRDLRCNANCTYGRTSRMCSISQTIA